MCKKHSPIGIILASLGLGVIIMCICPSKLVIFGISFALILCGVLLYIKS